MYSISDDEEVQKIKASLASSQIFVVSSKLKSVLHS